MNLICGRKRNKFYLFFFFLFWVSTFLLAKQELYFYRAQHLLLEDLKNFLLEEYPSLKITLIPTRNTMILRGEEEVLKKAALGLKKLDKPITDFWMELELYSPQGKLLYRNTQMIPLNKRIKLEKGDLVPVQGKDLQPIGYFFNLYLKPTKEGVLLDLKFNHKELIFGKIVDKEYQQKVVIRNSQTQIFYFDDYKIKFTLKKVE